MAERSKSIQFEEEQEYVVRLTLQEIGWEAFDRRTAGSDHHMAGRHGTISHNVCLIAISEKCVCICTTERQ